MLSQRRKYACVIRSEEDATRFKVRLSKSDVSLDLLTHHSHRLKADDVAILPTRMNNVPNTRILVAIAWFSVTTNMYQDRSAEATRALLTRRVTCIQDQIYVKRNTMYEKDKTTQKPPFS